MKETMTGRFRITAAAYQLPPPPLPLLLSSSLPLAPLLVFVFLLIGRVPSAQGRMAIFEANRAKPV